MQSTLLRTLHGLFEFSQQCIDEVDTRIISILQVGKLRLIEVQQEVLALVQTQFRLQSLATKSSSLSQQYTPAPCQRLAMGSDTDFHCSLLR